MEKKQEVYVVDDIRVKLGLSRKGAYDLVHKPDFPLVRAGRKLLIPVKAFEEWMQKGGSANERNKHQ